MKITFHPMLAASLPVDVKLEDLPYPLYASYKLDGVRATKQQNAGPLISRNDELIPNKHVQKLFKALPAGLDGELGCGDPTAPDFFRKTMSAVMSVDGTPDVTYYIFGLYDSAYSFRQRQELLQEWRAKYRVKENIKLVEQKLIHNASELEAFESHALKLGYEGVMLASPEGIYKQSFIGKHPRSTLNEFYLVKLKRFAHGEATIIGVEELMHNDNVKLKGKSRKQTLKENLRPAGVLGALVVRDLKTKVEFNIGTGFTDAERKKLWDVYTKPGNDWLHDAIIRYSYFPTGGKTKPRFPVFDGFRDKRDL